MKAIITVDLGHGDSCKGSVVDYLTNKFNSKLVIRSGGAHQCSHRVKFGNKSHRFSLFGSGSFDGAETLLLDTVIIDPFSLFGENKVLSETLGQDCSHLVNIHEDCLITTPFHVAWNRITERKNKHGSCGAGVYATKQYSEMFTPLRAFHLKDKVATKQILRDIQKNIQNLVEKDVFDRYTAFLYEDRIGDLTETYFEFSNKYRILGHDSILGLVNSQETLIFEANQGILLDENFGFFPHVSGDCSTKMAEAFLNKIEFRGEITKLGLIRSYSTRHGAGPFPSFDPTVKNLREEANISNEWQGDFKVGKFDLTLSKYALQCQSVDQVVISCLDNDPFDEYLNFPNKLKVPSTLEDQIENTEYLKKLGVESYFKPFSSKRNTIDRALEISNLLNTSLAGFSFGPDRENRSIFIRSLD